MRDDGDGASRIENCSSCHLPFFITHLVLIIQLEEGSPEYKIVAERNALDMILYNYIMLLYEEQKLLLDSYANPF